MHKRIKKILRSLLALLLLFGMSNLAMAHTINYDMAKLSSGAKTWTYLKIGFEHILPLGLDHILFVLSIFLLSSRLSTVLWQATAFTLAHSVTLGLAMYGYIKPLPSVIEPIIALSIFYVAVENLLVKDLKAARMLIVACFGLVHGMGFASALNDVGLPPSDYLLSLLSFNLGVELGQMTVILAAYFLVGKWFSNEVWYRSRVVNPASLLIALIALYWTIERTFYG